MSYLGRVVSLFACIVLFIGSVHAQNAVSTGAISGIVTDSSGAVVPGAQVELRNTETGITEANKTNSTGLYSYPSLSVGTYSIRVSAPGFKIGIVPSITVTIGRDSSANVRLQLGTANQQITVSAVSSPLLDTTNSSVGTNVNRKLVRNLPLSGRNYTDFVLLTPNATSNGEFGVVSFAGQSNAAANSYTLDGATATSNYTGGTRGGTRIPYLFGEESIQEFQVTDNPYSAAYGGAGAGFINTVTKSGSNKVHGSGFYYNRNSGTAADDAVDKSNGVPTPLNILQQFGGSAGGPILHNRLFYFGDYEQQRQKDPISVINHGMETLTLASFGLPASTVLPSPNAPFPEPVGLTAADANANNPAYLQQVANALNVIQTNIGMRQRYQNDLDLAPKIDWQATQMDHLTFYYNYNKFDSPGGEITYNPTSNEGIQALNNNYVRDHHATIHWTHTFSPYLLNDVYAGYLRDQVIATPSGFAPTSAFPEVEVFSPQFFILGNPTFSLANTRETEEQFNDHITLVRGRHTISTGFDYNHDGITDFYFGNFRGTYEFSNPEQFALATPLLYTQAGGNPTFIFQFPYYGFYVDDKYQVMKNLSLDMGVREDFQHFNQPQGNAAVPQTGKFPNVYERVAPRLGFAYSATQKTVVRGGFGVFYEDLVGSTYETTAEANGLSTEQSSLALPGNSPEAPQFPNQISGTNLFKSSANVAAFDPAFKAPYVLQSNLQVEQSMGRYTTFSVGTVWAHAVHLRTETGYDANLIPPTGTTTYIICPQNTPAGVSSCSGASITGPTLDNRLLKDGLINSNVGQINETFSGGLDNYNSLVAQLTRRSKSGLQVLSSFTYSKTMDSIRQFNDQFNFSNTHSPDEIDQRIRLSIAGVYQPVTDGIQSKFVRTLASNWTISTVIQFNSGRPYTGLLNTACTGVSLGACSGGDNLNNSAYNHSVGGSGISPAPNYGYNFFNGPWIDEGDIGLERRFLVYHAQYISLTAQVFNVTNHQNYFVQGGSGIQALQYNPVGPTCGDGKDVNQTCYLIPNGAEQGAKSPFGELESIDQQNPPRVWQFAFRYNF
ncbi:MAG: carboxypeptidase regulatory-like domain-containing protein [Acidobacteriaceae bacterium]